MTIVRKSNTQNLVWLQPKTHENIKMFASKILLASLAFSSSLAFAQGIVLNDQNLRTDLNWLNQQAHFLLFYYYTYIN